MACVCSLLIWLIYSSYLIIDDCLTIFAHHARVFIYSNYLLHSRCCLHMSDWCRLIVSFVHYCLNLGIWNNCECYLLSSPWTLPHVQSFKSSKLINEDNVQRTVRISSRLEIFSMESKIKTQLRYHDCVLRTYWYV